MNIFLLSAVVFALFIAVDLLSAKALKLKRSLVRNISLGCLCLGMVACSAGGVLSMVRNADKVTQALYHGYRYLMEGNVDKASEKTATVESPHADLINLLVDCRRENYAAVFIKSDDLCSSDDLNDDLFVQADALYQLSRQMTGLDSPMPTKEQVDVRLTTITNACFEQLKVSQKQDVEFLSGFQRDRMLSSDQYYSVDPQYLSQLLTETPNDPQLLRYSVNYYNAYNDLDVAEEYAKKLLDTDKSAEHMVLYADVIAQKLLNDVSISTYDPEDKEIAQLLQKAEDMERIAATEEDLAIAQEYRQQANSVKAKRIINWLMAQMPLFGDDSGVIDLQLSRLYNAAGNETKARKLLFDLLHREDRLAKTSPVKPVLKRLGAVYSNTTASDDEMNAAVNALLRMDAFLSDSVLSRGYSQFLNNILKYERISIYISQIDAANYPTVRAYLNVNGSKDGVDQLANDFVLGDFTITDNGFEIPTNRITRIEDDTNQAVSIALVVDVSGSMSGSRIENAKLAVQACIRNMSSDTQKLSIVAFDSTAQILTPLSNDKSVMEQAVSQLVDGGGTNISSGLTAGVDSLKTAVGAKSIILMSDGEDGSTDLMADAIAYARRENVSVFTISLGEADSEYMENIARQTGGTFMAATTEYDLINVYTALQSFIVNNYCFEYTISQDVDSNPRLVTVGLQEYNVTGSKMYGYGGLILTKDNSYVLRSNVSPVRLLYAEPAIVSVKDVELGVPIFLSGTGMTDGTKLYINGQEIKSAKVVDDMAITFTLKGDYQPGALEVMVRLADGTTQTTDRLLSVSQSIDTQLSGQAIALGVGGNVIYADSVEKKDDYTLKLSGTVVLNGFLYTTSPVTLRSDAPLPTGTAMTISGGHISGSGAAYADFSAIMQENYGQIAFGGGSVKLLDAFDFTFDSNTVSLQSARTTCTLPGFGDISGLVAYDGTTLTITADNGSLFALEDNLNYTLNGIPLPQQDITEAAQLILGYSRPIQSRQSNRDGIFTRINGLTVTVKKDEMHMVGNGTISGYLGLMEIVEGNLDIDTHNLDSMFNITGMVDLNRLTPVLGLAGQSPFTITSVGYSPDTFTLDAVGLSIATTLGEGALDGSFKADVTMPLDGEPYEGLFSSWLHDVALDCDKIELVYTNGLKVYHSSNPLRYALYTNDSVIFSIDDVDELSLFGSNLGGEIRGTVTVSNRQIVLFLEIDGHFDNDYYGIKHDGKATMTVTTARNLSVGGTIPIAVTYDGKTLDYQGTATGGIYLQDGFSAYGEEDGQ